MAEAQARNVAASERIAALLSEVGIPAAEDWEEARKASKVASQSTADLKELRKAVAFLVRLMGWMIHTKSHVRNAPFLHNLEDVSRLMDEFGGVERELDSAGGRLSRRYTTDRTLWEKSYIAKRVAELLASRE